MLTNAKHLLNAQMISLGTDEHWWSLAFLSIVVCYLLAYSLCIYALSVPWKPLDNLGNRISLRSIWKLFSLSHCFRGKITANKWKAHEHPQRNIVREGNSMWWNPLLKEFPLNWKFVSRWIKLSLAVYLLIHYRIWVIGSFN